MPDLPLKAQALLDSDFACLTSTTESCQTSSDGETTKLLIRLQDGLQIESVIMYYDTSGVLSRHSANSQLGTVNECLASNSQNNAGKGEPMSKMWCSRVLSLEQLCLCWAEQRAAVTPSTLPECPRDYAHI